MMELGILEIIIFFLKFTNMKNKRHIQSFNEHQENLNISDVSDSSLWWNKLNSTEKNEYFEMYSRDMERMDLLRATDVDELDELDIEQIYNDYYT